MRITYTISAAVLVLLLVTCGVPSRVLAYSQAYYEAYYQGYYQSYYQSYYQAGYYSESSYGGVTFTQPVTILGSTTVTGAVSKGGGSFVIDNPLDPLNKLLYHAFVESPDAKNIYDGIATLDLRGEAVVLLPTYFDALNKDVRYQLKPIDRPMPNLYVKEEEKNNRFTIGGGVASGKVSWQVTGIRKDAFILANPIEVEVAKGPNALVPVGQYVFPEGYQRFSLGGWVFLLGILGFLTFWYGDIPAWVRRKNPFR